MPTSQAHVIELRSGPMRLALRPDLGGCIAGLWLGDLPVLRSGDPQALDSVRLSGSYPLVPFSNRIGQAQLQWQGTSHPLVRNFGGEEHSIHGLGWQRAWGVLEQDEGAAFLVAGHELAVEILRVHARESFRLKRFRLRVASEGER